MHDTCYNLIVHFNSGLTMMFENVFNFKHITEGAYGMWQIDIADYNKYAYIHDRDVLFIGPQYIWDKMRRKDDSKLVEENEGAGGEPNLHEGCWFCQYQHVCDKPYVSNQPLNQPNDCPSFKKDF